MRKATFIIQINIYGGKKWHPCINQTLSLWLKCGIYEQPWVVGTVLGLLRAFGSCFHPCRRHHSSLKGFYIFCSQRKCTLCLKEEDQRHQGGKLPKTRVNYWCGCELLWRAKKLLLLCWGVFLRFVRLFLCVVVVGFLVARVLVCVYIKITWCHYCTMLCFKFKVPAWAETVKCLQIVRLNIYYKLCYLWVFSTALFNVRLKSGKIFSDFFSLHLITILNGEIDNDFLCQDVLLSSYWNKILSCSFYDWFWLI